MTWYRALPFLALGVMAVQASIYPVPALGESVHRYLARVDPALGELHVKACFAPDTPDALVAFDERAAQYLDHAVAHHQSARHALRARGTEISLHGLSDVACVEYQVSLDRAVSTSRRGPAIRVGRDLLLSPDIWLWRPFRRGAPEAIEIRFDLPAGVNVSVPWPVVDTSGPQAIYRVGGRPTDWPARMAFGRFEITEIPVGEARLRLAVLDGQPPADREAMRRWVEAGGKAVATLYGRFPIPSVQVLVMPIGRGREPVPWAEVMRGGGDAVHLYVDQTRPLEEFVADWTLAHELSHLLHPRIDSRDAWIYEGLASYYQNVLRARAGLLPPTTAWSELHAGFQRGLNATPPDRTLAQVTETMASDGLFMRVYWSGAAIALLADTELRRRSRGRLSLDVALARLQACCLPSNRWWTGPELMHELDRLSGTNVFTTLYRHHVHSARFPDLREAYRQLGIDARSGEVKLRDDAPLAPIRRAIMQGPDGPRQAGPPGPGGSADPVDSAPRAVSPSRG